MAGIMGVVRVHDVPSIPILQRIFLTENFKSRSKARIKGENREYLITVFVTTVVILGNSVPQVHMVSCKDLKPF